MQNRGMEEEGHSYVEHFEFEAECNTLSFSRQTIFRYYIKIILYTRLLQQNYIIYQVVTAKIILYTGLLQQNYIIYQVVTAKSILYTRLLQQNYIIYQVATAKLYYISGCYSKIRDIKVVECKAVCVTTVSFNGHFGRKPRCWLLQTRSSSYINCMFIHIYYKADDPKYFVA